MWRAGDLRKSCGLLQARLADAPNPELAIESRFEFTYDAAHGLAAAALHRLGQSLREHDGIKGCRYLDVFDQGDAQRIAFAASLIGDVGLWVAGALTLFTAWDYWRASVRHFKD